MDEGHLDGNGVAGTLQEVFATEATTLLRRCDGCGATAPLGAHRAYRGAGLVLRCPGCATVAVVVVDAGERLTVRVHGTVALVR